MIKPTRYDLYKKAITPKPKIDLTMITVEQCLLFAEWLQERFIKADGKSRWYPRRCADEDKIVYTTRELWEQYQKFLGNKRPVSDPDNR